MTDETATHEAPAEPIGGRRRPALIVAFPTHVAAPLPESGATLGRAWLASLGVADTEASTKHVTIDRAGGVVRIADAGSRNGTWVDGERLTARDRVTLDDGAVIRIGRTILVYREHLGGPLEPAPPAFDLLVGPFGLRGVTRAIEGIARSRASNVLVEGDTGVGKELAARAIAKALGRESKLGAVNVAGLAPTVFEAHVFGHTAGAFSGARAASPGIVVAHDGGALFLDEIGELALELQAKLLRVLENREVLAVGAPRPTTVDVLVIAATNRKLEELVERGAFRRDLYARLAMARVAIPKLAERAEDLWAVAKELARRAGGSLEPGEVEVEAIERLLLEPWPGNVRELDAALAAARRADPAPGLRLWALDEALGGARPRKVALTERSAEEAIAAAGGNVSLAAERLGVSRGRLLRLRKRAKDD